MLLLLSACAQAPDEREEDLRLQQEVIRELHNENEVLREVNDLLRKHIVQYAENISRTEELIDICIENYPALRNSTLDDIAPDTHVPISDILVSRDNVIITIPDIQQGIIAASASMEPYLDENDVVLERKPQSPAEIHEEDIIIFRSGDERIIHRVTEIGHDDQGWYARTKGDNNIRPDPGKVRFDDVLGLVVGVIY